ncbi:putative metallophosphoesterase YhaO [Rubripirellula amarantea]|uniref:Putative metallophosphoesterase YhaO n=1 Tax=Rubripirellula amarantea TaxID=2527999 RepID=A0A5C5WQ69_9BACT|nr:DNA repair exonuclease [Rubripirellula amarantea]TWT52580.1 putative metallophosphoesterase YhaO [Rubripirellula amarantea]
MPNPKILHSADIHLDSPLRNLAQYEDAPVDQIRGATRRALSNLVDLAISQEVRLVVIAGDLYDGDWPDQNTGLFFVSQATRLIKAGIPMVIIRGNHDAFNKMTVNLRLPKNPDGSEVMLSETEVDSREFDLGDVRVAVHGRSYRKQHERGDLVKHYPKARSGLFNLGVLHTGLTGLDGHISYAPCTPQQLADFGYDYWALGHIHKRGEHQIEGAAPVVFSGNIQGRKITEPEAKGCVIFEVDSQGAGERVFHPLDVVRWEQCSIDISAYSNTDDVMDYYESWLRTKIEEVDDRLLVPRIEMTGRSELHTKLSRDFDSIEASLRAASISIGGGQVWMEKFKLRSKHPDRSSTDSTFSSIDPSAIASITAVVDELTSKTQTAKPVTSASGMLFDDIEACDEEPNDPEATQGSQASTAADWISEELSLLLHKLPKELSGEDAVIDLSDDAKVGEWIEQAAGELMSRLQGAESE